MDNSNFGGLSPAERQRKTASEIARNKVLRAYEKHAASTNPKKSDTSHLKDSSIKKNISTEDFKRYHSAWQDYYQKYYSSYYSSAAKKYVATEKLKAERAAAEEKSALDELLPERLKNLDETPSLATDKFRQKIRQKAIKNAKHSRRHRHLIPIFAGLATVLIILFLQYNRLIFAPIMAYVSPGDSPSTEITPVDPTVVSTTVSADNKLIIPKLNIEVPVHFGISLDEVDNAMVNGVAHYMISGASAFPGEIGNTVITGHSAGDIYSNNQYKFIFSGLERLEDGDLIYINYNSTRYTYSVKRKEIIEPSNVSVLVYETNTPILTLITCTPLGTSRYRLLVVAEQISPTYETATTQTEISVDNQKTEETQILPSNEPDFFTKIWNFLTGKD